jgi:hypothetical protein
VDARGTIGVPPIVISPISGPAIRFMLASSPFGNGGPIVKLEKLIETVLLKSRVGPTISELMKLAELGNTTEELALFGAINLKGRFVIESVENTTVDAGFV